MKGITTELKVGVFALVVLSVLSYMTIKVSGREWLGGEGYTVYVRFSNVAGLAKKTKVKVAGVDAGVIDDMVLEGSKVKLRLKIYPEIRLYRDAVASIKASGLLGDKYLAIKPGSAAEELGEGDTITEVREPVDIDDLISRIVNISEGFQTLTGNINDIFGSEETKRALKATAANLAEITENLNTVIDANNKRLKETLDGINSLTASISLMIEDNRSGVAETVSNLREVSSTLRTDTPALVRDLKNASEELRALLEENRPRVASLLEKTDKTMASVQKVAERIEKGEGTLGKLVADERLYDSVNKAAAGIEETINRVERFKTFITFRGEHVSKLSDVKGYFYLTLQPRPDKYYLLGVVDDPLGSVSTTTTITTTNGETTVEKEDRIERKVEFTAQIAKRFGDTAFRIGLTENTVGLGMDQFFARDRVRVSADIWDFDNEEEGSNNPHLKIGVDYYMFRNVFVSAGMDNLLNSEWKGPYFGGGIRFEDEDFKYLFGAMPDLSTW